jgi:hypothetical protein
VWGSGGVIPCNLTSTLDRGASLAALHARMHPRRGRVGHKASLDTEVVLNIMIETTSITVLWSSGIRIRVVW